MPFSLDLRVPRCLLLLASMFLLAACGGDGGPRPATVADFGGYTLFINYWAEWCQPCREEIPELNEFQQRHPESVRVLGVNFDRVTGDALAAQEQALGVEFPTLAVDPRTGFGLSQPLGLPETLVVSGDGELLDVLVGLQTLETLEAALELARGGVQAGREDGL